jgi:asparagine synthase (glutamine-hydrolysing)
MPGLSFVCDFDEDLKQKETQLMQSLRSLVHSELYTSRVLYSDKSYFLGISGYDGYPFTAFQNDRYIINIEGKIYNKDQARLNLELQELADNIFRKDSNYKKLLSDWLLTTDGDFIIIILDKNSRRIIIFNDVLGRLPLYYYQTAQGLYASREIRFITNLMGNINFDKTAIAQYLLFGFPLASRTLFENIHRMPPATLIDINLQESKIRIEDIYTFNFDEKAHKDRQFKENVRNLYGLFLDATRNRAISVGKNIVGLSGGLDSRSVAAALHKLNIPFSGATYLDSNKKANHDARIAEKLAKLFGIDWKLFHLDSPTRDDTLEILKIKNGLVSLTMNYIVPYFKSVKAHYGNNMQYFTGDGGITLKPHSPESKISNSNELVNYIIKKHQIFSLGEVSSLTRIEKSEIVSELENCIAAYPEKEWENRYMHFLHFDRCFKWQFEGEDKNRCYFWSLTPFYSIPFFTYVMNCPETTKKRFNLYREFLLYLSPEAMAINNANWQFPITSKGGLFLYETVYPRLPFRFKSFIRNALKKQDRTNPVAKDRLIDLEEQIKRCSYINNYLSPSELKNLESINEYKFDNLNTITSVIEAFECTGSSIAADSIKDTRG